MARVPDTTITTAIIAALAGGTGAFLGASMSALLGERGRREDRRREQQRADAAVVGPVMAFLTDVEPDRLGLKTRSDLDEQRKVMLKLGARADGLHGDLLVLSAGHPSKQVSDLARQLAAAVRNAFTSTSWFVFDLGRHRGAGEQRQQSKIDHGEAKRLAEELLDEIARHGRQRRVRRWLRMPWRRRAALPAGEPPSADRPCD